MAVRLGAAPRVRVDGSSGRPVSARRGKTVEERRAEVVAANTRLRGQLNRDNGGGSTGVSERPSADPDLRTLETQRDTLRAQLLQLTGVLASRRDELAELRRGSAASWSQPPLASQRANGPHGHFQEYVMPSEPAAFELNASGLTPSDLDDSDYTELDFANDAAVVAAEGWGDESTLPEERSGDWREDMMSVISRDKRAAGLDRSNCCHRHRHLPPLDRRCSRPLPSRGLEFHHQGIGLQYFQHRVSCALNVERHNDRSFG